MAEETVVAMPQHGRTGGRSTTGCWTCRIRRKKCDEKREQCMTCLSLRLHCDGYGAKPYWMDGGPLEKQKAQELKMEVNKRRKRGRYKSRINTGPSAQGRRSSSGSQDETTAAVNHGNDTQNMGVRHHSLHYSSTSLPQTPTAMQRSFSQTQSETAADGWVQHSGLAEVAMSNDYVFDGSPYTLNQSASLQSLFGNPLAHVLALEDGRNDTTWDMLIDSSPPVVTTVMNMDRFELDSAYQSISSNTDNELVASRSPPSRGVLNPGGPKRADTTDDAQINYYVDLVLPSLFPFLAPYVLDTLRGKLLTIEAGGSAQILRLSTLAHSTFIQKQGLEAFGLCSDDKTDKAITRWKCEAQERIRGAVAVNQTCEQRTNSPKHETAVIDNALSVIQLMLLKIRQGLTDHEHLATLMEPLISECRPLASQGDILGNLACSVSVLMDILWSASARRTPLLTGDAARIAQLDIASLDLQQTSGSESWVFQYIAEATLLRLWKEECLASRSLNVAELVRKAMKLEQAMDKHNHEMELRESSGHRHQYHNSTSMLITKVYFAATKVYLRVLVSGAYPEVSDISNAVDEVIASLRALSNATLIRRLAWPICVAASLAESKHQPFFQLLRNGAEGDRNECSSVLQALAVAEETRRMRQASPNKTDTFDWMDAMESLGHKWVLL